MAFRRGTGWQEPSLLERSSRGLERSSRGDAANSNLLAARLQEHGEDDFCVEVELSAPVK